MVNLAPIVVVLMVVFIGLCRVLLRSAFTYDPERVAALMALDEREVIKDRPLLLRSVVVIGIAARAGHPITFWRFTKYGSVVAAFTIAVNWLYLYLRYYAFG